MKFYLASRYSNRDKLRAVAEELKEIGHEVTSRWLWTHYRITEQGSTSAPPEYREQWATNDFNDVADAEAVASFTCNGGGRGGRHVEFGVGLALGKTMLLIGEPEHLFHHHDRVIRVQVSMDSDVREIAESIAREAIERHYAERRIY